MTGSMRTFVTDGEDGETEAILKDQSVGPKTLDILKKWSLLRLCLY